MANKGYGLELDNVVLLAVLAGAAFISYKVMVKPLSEVTEAVSKPFEVYNDGVSWLSDEIKGWFN